MQINVISLDPGDTSGIVLGSINEKLVHVTVAQRRMIESELYNTLLAFAPQYIVCESFEYRNKSRAGLVLTSRNLIGIVNLYGQSFRDDCRVFMQSPAQGKSFFTNDKLKKMELYPVGLEHGRDALRHFLRWYEFGYGAKYKLNQPIEMVVQK